MSKTDRQIIDEVNDLAHTMLGFMNTGYKAPDGYKFYQPDEENERILGAWSRAVEVYEKITHTEVHDALQAVLEDEERNRPDPVATELRELASEFENSPAVRAAINKGADAIDELARIRREAKAYDDEMDDTANDGKNARPPEGDDYNQLLGILEAGK